MVETTVAQRASLVTEGQVAESDARSRHRVRDSGRFATVKLLRLEAAPIAQDSYSLSDPVAGLSKASRDSTCLRAMRVSCAGGARAARYHRKTNRAGIFERRG
jgi:hypothetical protein